MKAQTMDTVWLTSQGMRQLQADHEQLKQNAGQLQREVRQAILDFEEELCASKRLEQQVIQSKLEKLEAMLQRVRLLPSGQSATATVGSRITYRQNKTTQTVTLVNSIEADPSEGRVSSQSPLGAALLGKKAGDVAFMVTPLGERKFQLLEVK